MSVVSDGQYGRRLLISVIEERARNVDDRVYASIPLSNDPLGGFLDITYPLLKKAIDRCAWFLHNEVGPAHNFETLGWISLPHDFRYILLVYAAMKMGYKVFFPSPKNSIEAHLSLLERCKCSTFLRPKRGALPIVSVLSQQRPMRLVDVPDLDYFLNASTPNPDFPYKKSFDEARFEPCLVLHTSGSTGIPKPIVIKNGWFTPVDAYHNLPQVSGGRLAFAPFENLRCFFPFPMFHAASMMNNLSVAVYWNVTMVHAPSSLLTADLANLYITSADVQAAILPTSVLKDLSQDEQMVENVGRLQYLAFTGSPIAPEVGRTLEKKTHLVNAMGSTEASYLPFLSESKEDWAYLRFGPHSGCEFRQVDLNRYEMVLIRDPALDIFQGVFVTFPELEEFSTKDVYSKHPTKQDHWHYEGRSDDIIILSNGEKLNPLTIEQSISNHPEVLGAIVVGNGRFQPCLLVEPEIPTTSTSQQEAFINTIWPTIDQVNKDTVAHGRIDKNLVLVTHPSKPLPRAGKGTLQRKLSVQTYENEIDRIYTRISDIHSPQSTLDLSNDQTIRESLRNAVSQQMGLDCPPDHVDLFSQGLDSIQVINLSRQINSTIGINLVSPRTIYSNGTIQKLGEILSHREEHDWSDAEKDRETHMENIYQDFVGRVPKRSFEPLVADTSFVILTGSTGSVGSYILDAISKNSEIGHIYCLNRSKDANERQEKSQSDRGLSTDLSTNRVTFFHADFALPSLGLSNSQYQYLLHHVTHVIHNAWAVNFNRPVDSFTETHINGVRQLIEFSTRSSHGAHIYFLSTISTTQNWQPPPHILEPRIPEQVFEDWSVSEIMGYAESKHIGERLLALAATHANVPTTICRIGQIAGPVKHDKYGVWNRQEWLPSIIASSRSLKVLPESLGSMDETDWIPVDMLADVIVELALGSDVGKSDTAQVHHLVNPRKETWSRKLKHVVRGRLGDVKIVRLSQWVDELAKSEESSSINLDDNPAVKLISFYEWLSEKEKAIGLTLDTKETEKKSAVLRDMPPVSKEWMELWLDQWKF